MQDGEALCLNELLDPGASDAAEQLKALWPDAIHAAGIRDDMLWEDLDIVLSRALTGEIELIWGFNSDGMNLKFQQYDVAPYALGDLEVTLGYASLQGVIHPLLLPIQRQDLSMSPASIVAVSGGKHHFLEENAQAKAQGRQLPHPIYGQEGPGAHLIAVEGAAQNLRASIGDDVQRYHLFYANFIQDALFWLPNAGVENYHLDWETNGEAREAALSFKN